MLYLLAMLHQTHRLRTIFLALALAGALGSPRALGGHEVPARVAIQAFVVPAGRTVRVVARVPLEAMRDLDVPLRDDGSLDIARVTALLPGAAQLWVADYLTLYEDGRELSPARIAAVRVSLPSDRSFGSPDAALAHVAAPPLPEGTGLLWQAAMFDLVIAYDIASPDARFAIEPRLAHLGVRTTTVLRLVLPDGAVRAFQYEGDPGRIELDPSWANAAGRFVAEGFRHILGGLDHLLFVLCLVLPVRRWRPLVAIVTAFTVAHSLTLGAAALGVAPTGAWFPPLVEALIALSIVVLAVENLLRREERLEDRWRMAFGFGLIHGFGFSFALGEQLQFAGGHLATSLGAFNVGVELGQLLVLALAVPALAIARRYAGAGRERIVVIVGSVLVAHTAWHWMTERFSTLGAAWASFAWPALDLAFALAAVRAALLAAVALALALGFRQILRVMSTRSAASAILLVLTAIGAPDLARAQDAASASSDVISTADGVYTAEQADRGKDVFASACQSCHTPTVHAGPPFRNRWFGRSLGELFTYLRENMPQSDPGTMSDEEYVLVTAYLLRINGMKPGDAPLAPELKSLERIRLDSMPSKSPTAGPNASRGPR